MEAILLQSGSKEDMEMIAKLAKKIGIKIKHLSNEQLEDIGLANAMKKGRTGKYIDTEKFLKKLESK